MSHDFSSERNSPSSPQEQAEPRLEAGEGLDVTACSASSFCVWCGALAKDNPRGRLPSAITGGDKEYYFCGSWCDEPWCEERGINYRLESVA